VSAAQLMGVAEMSKFGATDVGSGGLSGLV